MLLIPLHLCNPLAHWNEKKEALKKPKTQSLRVGWILPLSFAIHTYFLSFFRDCLCGPRWTLGNVSIALLGGLPLLAIEQGISGIDSVACLLVGLASQNIMSTYLSDARRAARTRELARRYYLDKGRTCRGSGVRCIREAMDALGLPRSASQLDGVIAFSVGWAMEAVLGLPGNQKPRDGQNHCQIEDEYSSSRAYRFPDQRL